MALPVEGDINKRESFLGSSGRSGVIKKLLLNSVEIEDRITCMNNPTIARCMKKLQLEVQRQSFRILFVYISPGRIPTLIQGIHFHERLPPGIRRIRTTCKNTEARSLL